MGGRRKETPPHETLPDFQISFWCSLSLALLITGAAVIPQINRGQQEPTSGQEMVGVVNGMETVASAEELSQKVGVPVSDLKDLPFTVEHTKYTNGWGEFAQIDYEGVDADGDARVCATGKEPAKMTFPVIITCMR